MIKRLVQCVSKEETRPQLTGVYYDWDAETKVRTLVATDGHRIMTWTPPEYCPDLRGSEAGWILDPAALLLGHAVRAPGTEESTKYPAWRSLVPRHTETDHVIKWSVPCWVSKVKVKDRGRIGFKVDGSVMLTDADVYVNLAYLAPIASCTPTVPMDVTITWKDALSPVFIKPVDASLAWTYIVMPVRK